MKFKCRKCGQREFISRNALHQHYRQAPGHYFCTHCELCFNDQEAFESHNATAHPDFKCTICEVYFSTQSSLEDHYRGKAPAIHPKCPRCGRGCFNQAALTEHHTAAHPSVRCPCGRTFYAEDLGSHYTESPMHPSCSQCHLGFKDDEAYDKHLVAEHSERRCVVCRRQFFTVDELNKHFALSPIHARCSKCEMGFVDDDHLNEHFTMSPEHPNCFKCQVGFADDVHYHEHVTKEHGRLVPMSSAPQLKGLLAIEEAPTPKTVHRLPPPDKDVSAMWTSFSNKNLSSLTVAPDIASVIPKPMSSMETPSPRLFQLADRELRQARGVNKTLATIPSERKTERKTLDIVPHPVQGTPRPSASESPFNTPKSGQGIVRSATLPFVAALAASNEEMAKTISPQSSTSSFDSSYTGVSEHSSNAGTRVGHVRTRPASHGQGAVVAPMVRCMLCSRIPCIDPTAAMCGHVFCRGCITQKIIEAPSCPKCDRPTVLYCLFELHLDD